MSDGTDPRTVSARIMGIWAEDPFLKEINVDAGWPQCPFREQHWCRAADVKGTRKASVSLSCPTRSRGMGAGAPPQCPLRYGEIVVRRKE